MYTKATSTQMCESSRPDKHSFLTFRNVDGTPSICCAVRAHWTVYSPSSSLTITQVQYVAHHGVLINGFWMNGSMNEWMSECKHYILSNHILRNLESQHFINFFYWTYLKYFIKNLNGTECIKSVSFLPQNSEATLLHIFLFIIT